MMHPGPSGELGVLRYTAKVAGKHTLAVTFTGRSVAQGYPTTSDVSVRQGSVVKFTQNLNVSPVGNAASYGAVFELNAGDTIDLAVGRGSNNDYRWDATGVDAVVYGPV